MGKNFGDTLGIPSKQNNILIQFSAFKSVMIILKSIEDFTSENGFIKTLVKRRLFGRFCKCNVKSCIFKRSHVNTLF